MDLRQMEYMVTLADEQQFTRAASICGISQSGLSAAMRSLEEELGVVLFDRTTRRVEPTDAGLALLPHARAMLSQAASARDAVVQAARQPSGRLRVGAEQCLGFVDAVSLLGRVHRRYPGVDLDFTQAGSHELVSRVRDGSLDVAFVATDRHLGRLVRRELGRKPVTLLCPADHPLAVREVVHWNDLGDRDFVDFHESWAMRSVNDAACTAHGVRRRVRCTVNEVHALLDLVQRGFGLALVPQHVATKPQAAGLVAVPFAAGSAPQWIVSAVTGESSDASVSLLFDLLDADRAA